MYDVMNVCLWELILGYLFLEIFFVKIKFIKGLDFILVVCNLFFLYKDVLFDLDVILLVGNIL